MYAKKIFSLVCKMFILVAVVFIIYVVLGAVSYFYATPKIIKGLTINGVNYTLIKNRFLDRKFCKQYCYEVVYCFDENNGICTQDLGHSSSGSLIQANKILDIYVKDQVLHIVLPKNTLTQHIDNKFNENNHLNFTIYNMSINAMIEYS